MIQNSEYPEITEHTPRHQMSQSLLMGILLALNGGYLEVYTYTTRDQVFANAQTGNIVLAAISAAQGDWPGLVNHLIPVVTFAFGVTIVLAVKSHLKRHIHFHWRQAILLTEILILACASLIPSGPWNAAVNFMVAFACALQYGGFKKFRGTALATTFCTGNLRSATEFMYSWNKTGDREKLRKSLDLITIIIVFFTGAILSARLTPLLHEKSVLVSCGFLIIAFLIMFIKSEEEKVQLQRKEKADPDRKAQK